MLGGLAGTLLLYYSIIIPIISLPRSQGASFVLTYHSPYCLGTKPVKINWSARSKAVMLPISMHALQAFASLWILWCLNMIALGLFLLSQAACLCGRNVRSLRPLMYCQILLKLAEVMRQMSKLDWHDYNSQMLTWANKPGSLSLGQNSCSLKYCWMMSGVHAKKYSREKEVDRRYGANIPPLCICQVHWGRMLTVLESQQHVQDLMLEERRKWTLSKDSQGPEGCCFSPKSPAGLTD